MKPKIVAVTSINLILEAEIQKLRSFPFKTFPLGNLFVKTIAFHMFNYIGFSGLN